MVGSRSFGISAADAEKSCTLEFRRTFSVVLAGLEGCFFVKEQIAGTLVLVLNDKLLDLADVQYPVKQILVEKVMLQEKRTFVAEIGRASCRERVWTAV